MLIKFELATLNDVKFMNEIRNCYVKEYLHNSTEYSLNEAITWFNTSKPEYYIILLNEKKIGYFRTSNHSKNNKNIYIGADLHPDFIGKNLAYESYNKFINFLFDKHDLNKLSLEVLATNDRAIKLYKKIGFIIEGTKRQEIYKNNMFVDSILMSILKKDWEYKTINE